MKKLSDWDEELLDLDEEDSDKEAFDDEFGYGAGMLDRKLWFAVITAVLLIAINVIVVFILMGR